MRTKNALLKLVAGLLVVATLGACTDDAWKRGQPPAPETLYRRAQSRLSDSLAERSNSRETLAALTKVIRDQLGKGTSDKSSVAASALRELQDSFLKLEGNLSLGSRPAHAELSKQLAAIVKDSETSKDIGQSLQARTLFAARVMFFLAEELRVSAPSKKQA